MRGTQEAGRRGTYEVLSSHIESTLPFPLTLGVALDISHRDPGVAKKPAVFLLVVRAAPHLFCHQLESLLEGCLLADSPGPLLGHGSGCGS